MEELDKMVGQTGIKKQIRDFVELARHYSHEGVKLSSRMSLQWCLTGNSAMGKGTVARIIARLYKAMGIVDKGQVFDFKVERMIGLMEDEAQRSIGEALVKSSGGILLFDEDSPKLNEAVGFRERVRALLMNQMAEHPGSYIIIYAEPRNRVSGINGDAEHMSDLVNVLVFEDYTKEELMIILKRRLEKERMKMTATARQYMTVFIGSLVATEERSHASSRLMRIVADDFCSKTGCGYVYRSFCGRSNERTEKNRIHLNRADKKVERYKEIGNEKANDIVDLYAVIGIGRM